MRKESVFSLVLVLKTGARRSRLGEAFETRSGMIAIDEV
jgi:hypothetical protein